MSKKEAEAEDNTSFQFRYTYISMPYTNLGTKRHRHREHLFQGNIQYKGCGTKRTMVEASNVTPCFFVFFPV